MSAAWDPKVPTQLRPLAFNSKVRHPECIDIYALVVDGNTECIYMHDTYLLMDLTSRSSNRLCRTNHFVRQRECTSIEVDISTDYNEMLSCGDPVWTSCLPVPWQLPVWNYLQVDTVGNGVTPAELYHGTAVAILSWLPRGNQPCYKFDDCWSIQPLVLPKAYGFLVWPSHVAFVLSVEYSPCVLCRIA